MKFEQFPQQPSQEPVTPEPQEAATEDNQLDILISLERTGDSEKLDSLLREAINELRKTNPTLAERLAYERIGVYV
jgi:translation initiation factor 2B subunit (eIF-2B alpha/beta/delta family)